MRGQKQYHKSIVIMCNLLIAFVMHITRPLVIYLDVLQLQTIQRYLTAVDTSVSTLKCLHSVS